MRWPIVAVAAVAATPGLAAAAELDAPLRQALSQVSPDQEVAVIVIHRNTGLLDRFPGGAQLRKELRLRADRDLPELEQRLRGRGATLFRRLWTINGVATRLPASAIQELANDPSVAEIRLDATVQEPQATYESGAVAPEWNIAMVRAPDLWAQGHFGKGVTVAVMDTGIDRFHPELAGKWRGGGNSWFDPSGQHSQPSDNSGHGTHVASIVLGGRDGAPAIGMAPQARWIGAKIFNDSGQGSLSGIHASFQWLLDPDDDPATDDAPQVVVASWNLNGTTNVCATEFAQDIALLRQAGIAMVFSAGNTGPGPNTSVSPANNAGAFPVGAVAQGAVVSPESGRGVSACGGGLYPAVAAPGVSVRVADLTYDGVFPDSYAVVSGTSFAAPHVAGAMALLTGARGNATAETLEAALTKAATDTSTSGADNDSGHG
ncbi:MAG TPA: S8 family serine peptidase, partial [Candidatus Omnitrophota bacterium]|nr:S8 family serine peptidase [Candidatus Omnitrophota bacterium]